MTVIESLQRDTIDLSVILVSWNTKALLKDCLESLYRHTSDVTFEIFVVDNVSKDGSAEMVKEFFPDVLLIQNKANVGFSRANNQAILLSRGRYIALLNPDTVLVENVFLPLVQCADQNQEIGAIGPKILSSDGRTIQNVCARNLPSLYYDFCRLSGLARKFSGTRLFGGEYMSYWDHMSSRNVQGLVGACMVVRKNAIDDVGLMDENQFMFGDEIDWCKRLIKSGWTIFYYAHASIIHYGGESSKQVKSIASVEAEKALKYYYKKHNGPFYALLFSVQVLIFSLGKYIWSLFFRRKNDRTRELMTGYRSIFTWSFSQLINKE
jgi:GT2 family glycosyltransferase